MTLLAYKFTLLCAFGNMMGSVFQYGYALGVMNSLRYENYFSFPVGWKYIQGDKIIHYVDNDNFEG